MHPEIPRPAVRERAAKAQHVSFSIREFGARHGLSRTAVYREIAAGRLEVRKVGRRSIITGAAEAAWLDALPVLRIA